jgi:hypothetical protein
MTSSSEAFEKFSMWRKERICLKVTVIERGQPEDVYSVKVRGLDEAESLVELRGGIQLSFLQFDVTGAEFSLEPGRMVVSRDDIEWLIFEEDDRESD